MGKHTHENKKDSVKFEDILDRVDLSRIGFHIDTTPLRDVEGMNRRIQRSFETNEAKVCKGRIK